MYRTRLYREQHGRIRQLLQPLVSPSRDAVPATILRTALAKVAGAVKMHLRDEDHDLYPALLTSESPDVRATATEFRETTGGLASSFSAFYEKWIRPGAIDARRSEFFSDADVVLGALSRRMDLEDGTLYRLADGEAAPKD
jgi:hypothetical protein